MEGWKRKDHETDGNVGIRGWQKNWRQHIETAESTGE